jgi:hypothetical protein
MPGRSRDLRLATVLVVAAFGVLARGSATSDAAGIAAVQQQHRSTDYASVVLDTFDAHGPAVVQGGGRTDDRLNRVLKPVVGTAALLALAWALAAGWCHPAPRRLWSRNVVCERAAPRGPPVRLT